jgi:hypothetical protein
MKNKICQTRKIVWVLCALFIITVRVQGQTFVKVMVDRPEKLEILAEELFTQTGNLTILGDNVSIEGGISPYRFSWFKDGNVIGTSLILEVSKSIPTNRFALTVKDARNCSCTRNAYLTNSENIKQAISNIAVYPNPASNYIILNPEGIEGRLDVSFFDVRGILLMTKQISGTSVLDFKLRPGMYFLRIEDRNKQILGLTKLIVL